MNGLLHLCCGICGRAYEFIYAPAGEKFAAKWMECINEKCPDRGKRYDVPTVELKEQPR